MAIKLDIRLGGSYSNGEFGNRWVVRQIISITTARDEIESESVTFKVLVGPGRRSKGSCTLVEFEKWARHEVVRNENSWGRVEVESDV
ncbi:hypothetical protein [Sulfurirhabdus autotrophica]|uniref:Uncharacterized protein n=1 Tax=Sulfurirhabdus autotrophica TaxID=1706046 RepID=A0A4R3XY30_9PROT|nr:hypothetical protein [Sulfurirhabdus autotrophica]TCV82563.1 hypothetical protein EDC63_12057 [Sulfurirhabdus autotrophica]